MTKNFTIKIYKSFDDYLKQDWIEFEAKSENYCFQNFSWLKQWYELYKIDRQINACIMVVYSEKKIISILPFMVEKIRKISFLRWMGDEQADYMCGLFEKDFYLEKVEFVKLWKLIKKELPHFDIIHFYKQPEYIGKITNPFIVNLRTVKNGYASGIDLKNNFEEYIKNNLKKKFFNDTRRSLNQLNARGNLEFKIYDEIDDTDKIAFIKNVLEQKILRLKQLKLKNNFNENIKKF